MREEFIDSIEEKGIKDTLFHGPKYLLNSVLVPKLWPLTHHPAQVLLNHREDEYDRSFDRGHIGVLGRGPSLKNVHELDFVDTFIIVNEFEMGDPTVRDTLKDKDLLHFVKISEPTLSFRNYYRFNFVGYQLRTMESEDGTYTWREPRGGRGKPELYGFTPRFLPEEIDPIMKEHFTDGINTNGIFAVLYAAEVSDADHIYTAGIDFMESGVAGYLSSEDPSEEKIEERESRSQDLMDDMNTIASIYPDIDFHIVTQSTYDPDIENVHIYRRGLKPGE
jgi:hypothetical protein